MSDIHIRIPDDINAKLNSLARRKKTSRNELIKIILTDYAISPDIKNIENKYENLVKDVTSLYQAELEKTREQLEENNYLLKQLTDKM